MKAEKYEKGLFKALLRGILGVQTIGDIAL